MQDLVVCRKDASEQQECTTSSPAGSSETLHKTSVKGLEPVSAEDTSSATHATDPAEAPAVQHLHLPSLSSTKPPPGLQNHSPDAALAESELMAENVPEAVQRLTSCDITAASSTSVEAATESSHQVLTSPTSLALPATEACNRIGHSQDDDSDSEYGLEFNPYSFVRTLPPLADVVDKHQKPLLPPQTRRFSKKTLVLDLDETLVSLSAFAMRACTWQPHAFRLRQHLCQRLADFTGLSLPNVRANVSSCIRSFVT